MPERLLTLFISSASKKWQNKIVKPTPAIYTQQIIAQQDDMPSRRSRRIYIGLAMALQA